MSANIKAHAANVERFPYNASIFFQTGGPPKLNDMFFQKDAARSLRLLVNAEQRALVAGKSRQEALEAVRDVFYKGEIAHAIVKLHQEQGGLFTYDDLATYRGTWEEPGHRVLRRLAQRPGGDVAQAATLASSCPTRRTRSFTTSRSWRSVPTSCARLPTCALS
jgi:gamma-glutamyltranspeptidase